MTALPTGTVTFLVTDIEGSTELLQRLGAAGYRSLLAEHDRLVRTALAEHGGVELSTEGDSFFAAFDRASDALAAAVAVQLGLVQSSSAREAGLRVRAALHTGEPSLIDGQYVGLDLHRVARLREAGHGGQVLLSALTRDLLAHDLPLGIGLRDLGEHRLRDLPRGERVFQLEIEGLPVRFPPLRGLESRHNNLPTQLTSFIGRERVVTEVTQLLNRARLVTLTGPGGSGKTRLAVQVATVLLPDFPAGAFFVGLAPISEPTLVVSTTAQTLGVHRIGDRPPLEGLKDFLRDRQLLLILDNFEQVLTAGPEIVELLTTCPLLKVLVTSRIALRVSGEREYAVPPLLLPPADALGAGEGAHSEAVQLFAERAQAVRSDFELTDELSPTVAEICRRLDGLPLAIELAAARVRLLTPTAILGRLEHRLQLLTGGARDLPTRQRTLRDAIGWSYDLLEPAEQALFRRLAVFVGGFTLEAAGAVTGDSDVFEGVESLVTKSLVRPLDGSDEPRFDLLETIREFGLEQLSSGGELAASQRQHAEYFRALAAQAVPRFRGPEQLAWLDRLEAEHDNFRAALGWALGEDGDPELVLELSGALTWFWEARSHVDEGRRWLNRSLGQSGARSAARMRALQGAGWMAHFQRDSLAARTLLEESLTLAREAGDQWAVGWVLYLLGRVAYFDDDAATARALAEQSLASARLAGDPWLISHGPHLLGLAAHIEGDYPTAILHYQASLSIRQEIGFQQGIAVLNSLLAIVAFRQGNFVLAHALNSDCLDFLRRLRNGYLVNVSLALASGLAATLDQPERSARLAGASATVTETVHALPIPLAEAILQEAGQRVRTSLGEAAFSAAWSAGRAMSIDEAVCEALAVEVAPPAGKAGVPVGGLPERPAGLTPAEVEVLRRLARGHTTRQIADELIVAVSTVDRHISHIYDKIGSRSRAAAAAFALRHGLT